ncbi:MAG: methyltransferase domain-containing protein [Planctomycetes bacterium]|nr:methyltransferase domain-containing protein [Planctomycetota bacterium]MBL7040189.1 methyltransferase domain-containing protein [Pirellulaceae bacterium]
MALPENRTKTIFRQCQLCGTHPLERFISCNMVSMWQCPNCDLLQYGTLYAPEQYDGAYDQIYGHRLDRKVYTAAMRLNRVAAVLDTDHPRLLEMGCNLGATMEAARRRGWEVVGVDVSEDVVSYCQKRDYDCVAIDGLHLPFPDESFDVITAWHVIEHVADVRQTLAEWRRVLRPGGVVALETPDASSPKVQRRGAKYGKFWRAEHTYVFTPQNLGEFVKQTGFELMDQPSVGRLTDLPLANTCYSVAHRLLDGLLYATGNHKAFQIFARRVETVPATLPLRRAA